MATVINFFGKQVIEPGAYAAMVYNPTSVVNVAEFGNTFLIDPGLNLNSPNPELEFAGGSGWNGTLEKGEKTIYAFDTLEDFVSFMNGGLVGDISRYLFTPRAGQQGIPKLFYCRAATTTPASATVPIGINGFQFLMQCKNEGIGGNAFRDTDNILRAGYSVQIVAVTSGFVFRIMRGTFKGADSYGEPFFGNYMPLSKPEVVLESGVITTYGELVNFCNSSRAFNAHFKLTFTPLDGTNNDYPLAAVPEMDFEDGTTVYDPETFLPQILETITDWDITFHLGTNWTLADATAATNSTLFTWLKTQTKFTQFMVMGGGNDDTDLLGDGITSQAVAKYFDSEQVVICHCAPEVPFKDTTKVGFKRLNTIYWAAAIIGMAGGGAPQTPLTFKRVGFNSFVYNLKKREREKTLQAGILHPRNVNGNFVVNQGVTTLQDNFQTISLDAQSLEFSIALIKAQMNKELIMDAENRFPGRTVAQSSPEDVKNFTETKLASFVATIGNDNLIVDWKNVSVKAKNGDYSVTYDFVPNVPLNKLFFIGNMLDFSF